MGRPKGSGRGLVQVGLRLEPEVYETFKTWHEEQHADMKESEAMRALVRWALENVAGLDKRLPAEAVRAESLRRARADLHQALNEAWEKLAP